MSYERLKNSLQKDLTVKLLKMGNEQKEQEKRIKDKANSYLLWVLLLTLLLTGVAIYFRNANYKSKQELDKRHAEREVLIVKLSERNTEKTLLINEIHHRVKNNLQLMYSLARLQLPTIKEENDKLLWQKHLTQIKAMALVNEKRYNTEGVASVALNGFMTDILTHFEQIYLTNKLITVDNQVDKYLVTSADFATSFGLLFSELVSNAYKHAFSEVKHPKFALKMVEKEGMIIFDYTDFGILKTPSVFLTKNNGGTTLIQDLTRQLKGQAILQKVPYLAYRFSFPISKKEMPNSSAISALASWEH